MLEPSSSNTSSAPNSTSFALWRTALPTGLIVGFISTFSSVSLASLIFANVQPQELTYGIAVALMSTAIVGLVMIRYSGIVGLIANVQSVPALMMAVAVAGMAQQITDPDALLSTTLTLMLLATFFTGALLVLLGIYRLGSLVRFLPYPVMGGFLTGTGLLYIIAVVGTSADYPLTIDNLPALLEMSQLLQWLPGMLFGVLILVVTRRIDHPLILPIMLILGLIAFHAVLLLTGTSISEARNAGYLLAEMRKTSDWSLPLLRLEATDWNAIFNQLGSVASIFIVTPMAILLNISGVEISVKDDTELNHELRGLGLANMLSGLTGGMIAYHSLSTTTLSEQVHSRNRLTGIISALVPFTFVLIGMEALSYLPELIPVGLLTFIGLTFVYEWAIEKRASLVLADYVVVLVISLTIVLGGFLLGILLGMFIMIVMFVYEYSRTNILYHELSGADISSNVERNHHHMKELNKLGKHTSVMALQGFIFFGTANTILEKLNARLSHDNPPLMYLILDFKRVTGIDSSAAFSLVKVLYKAETHDFKLMLSNLSPVLRSRLINDEDINTEYLYFFDDLDHALEWTEDQLMEHFAITRQYLPVNLEKQLISQGMSKDHAKQFKEYLEPIMLEKDEVLIEAGAKSNDLYFIEIGQLTVYVDAGKSAPVRVQTLSAGTTVGEIAFLLERPRTAHVKADYKTRVYRLTREMLRKMETEAPELSLEFKELLLRSVTEKLTMASKEISALIR